LNLLKYIKNPITPTDLINSVKVSVSENEQILTQLQKDQWSEGKDKNGQIIGKYSKSTQYIAKESGINNKIAGQPYNLDWTGQLKRQTDIKTRTVTNDVLVQIDSSSPTLLPLFETIEKYGFLSNPNTIFGYQPQKKDVVINIIKTTALSKLKRKLNV
jgi:hypothetical protein